jgi:hypothetical protein
MAGGSPPPKSRRLSRAPSDQDHAADLSVRRGFADLEELFAWPDRAWQTLQSHDASRPLQLAALADAGGVQLFSYMAGKGTDGTCVKYLCRCMRKYGLVSHDAADPFVMVHANDHMEFCIDVLTGMKDGPDNVYQHVFGKGPPRDRQRTANGPPTDRQRTAKRTAKSSNNCNNNSVVEGSVRTKNNNININININAAGTATATGQRSTFPQARSRTQPFYESAQLLHAACATAMASTGEVLMEGVEATSGPKEEHLAAAPDAEDLAFKNEFVEGEASAEERPAGAASSTPSAPAEWEADVR